MFASLFVWLTSCTSIPQTKDEQAYIKFIKTINTVRNEYVDEVNTTVLIDKAIKGLMENLDAHSAFMNAEENSRLKSETKGEFAGVGFALRMKNNMLVVLSALDVSPAFKAGIKKGDIIVKIDGVSIVGMNIYEAIRRIKGKVGTRVELTVARGVKNRLHTFSIIRETIKIKSVITHNISSGLLYIKINSFDKNVCSSIRELLQKHHALKGIILDLRDNPGGVLSQAVCTVDMFVKEGIIVSQKRASTGESSHYTAHAYNTYSEPSIVVLVNGGSASAAEIVSGALQDKRRAIVVGEETFGKGSVQAVIPMDKKEALKLTVARYYLPSGRSIQAKGIVPDIIVHQTKKGARASLKERDLRGYLKNDTNGVGKKVSFKAYKNLSIDKNRKLFRKKWIKKDRQLLYGIVVLKKMLGIGF